MLDFRPDPDPDLPGFVRLLDPREMRDVFAEVLRTSMPRPVRVAECRIKRFRYRPETRAIALFELELVADDSGTTTRQWACGTVFAGNKARKTYWRIGDNNTAGTGHGNGLALPAFSYVDDMGLLVQWYPADRHLPDIAAIFAGAHTEFTTPLSAAHGLDPESLGPAVIESMRYRPGESATLKISVGYEEQGRDADGPAAFVKIYRRYDRAALLELWGSLAEAAAESGGAFAIPGIAGVVPGRNAMSILPARGRTLEDLLGGECEPEALAALCVDALLALQQSGARLAHCRDFEASMARFKRAANFLGWGDPRLRPRIKRIGETIEKRFRTGAACPAHLDLKLDHIFVDESGRVTFIDVDSAGIGDPMLDPGQLIARLDLMPPSGEAFARHAGAFRDAYLARLYAQSPAGWTRNFAPAYALGAIKVALYFFQHLESRWRQSVDVILARIESALDGTAA